MSQHQIIGFGDILRHNKRGSEYRVVCLALTMGNFKDQDNTRLLLMPHWKFWVAPEDTTDIPNMGRLAARPVFQLSEQSEIGMSHECVVYASVIPKAGIYVRPRGEFTSDRFTIVKGLAQ